MAAAKIIKRVAYLPYKICQLYLVKHQAIHTTAILESKLFLDKENKHAHDILKESVKTYQLVKIPDAATITSPTDLQQSAALFTESTKVYNQFLNLYNVCKTSQIPLSSSVVENDVKSFCKSCHKLEDEQLINCLKLISQFPAEQSVRAQNYMQLWNTLDIQCCQRIEKWKTDQILLCCDAWYHLSLMRISHFVNEATKKLGRVVRKLKPQQLVQTMFILNITRRSLYEMHDCELNLERSLDELTIQELAIISMGFFKTQTQIRNPALIEQLYKRVLAEVNTIEDITLVALLKILRYSSQLSHAPVMMELLEALSGQLHRFSLLSCLHIALLGSDLQCCHDGIVIKILHRFDQEIEETRLKDLERICFILGLFNIKTTDLIEDQLCEKILVSLEKRIPEILKHPRCFPTCLNFLAIKGYYNEEMISSVLDQKFLQHAYGKNLLLGRAIFSLDSFVKINLKATYNGNQLQSKYRRTMAKLLTHYLPARNPKYKLSTTDRILLEIKETTENMHRHVAFKHILPHYERPDIVLCYDQKSKKSICISNECPEDYSGVILSRNELLGINSDNIDTVAIVVAGWNNIVRDKHRYTGLFASKLNQLKLLGHKYIVISWNEWRELETVVDRIDHIKRKLSKVI